MIRSTQRPKRATPDRRKAGFHRKFLWNAQENDIGKYPWSIAGLLPCEREGATMTMKAKRNLKTVAWIAMLVAVIAIAGIEPALAQGR